jgi:hypothetical protein
MPKNVFDTLKLLNEHDIQHGTRIVQISNTLIRAQKVKAGAEVVMGVPENILTSLLDLDPPLVLLLVIDRKEFKKHDT